jgi:hypothetical protein
MRCADGESAQLATQRRFGVPGATGGGTLRNSSGRDG